MKGRELMNIFHDKSSIFGEVEVLQLNNALLEFFKQASEIRQLLGKQAYLLDEYISSLLEAANQTVVVSPASAGFEIDPGQLNRICLSILHGDEKENEHPFYQQAKKFIVEHPLPFQELSTKFSIYCALLVNDFLNFSIERYQKKLEDDYSLAIDICDFHELFQNICSLLGGEELMEQLNLLFRERFLIATAMQIYLQGMTNHLMYALTTRDRETQKYVFQILLDGGCLFVHRCNILTSSGL